MGHDYGAVRHSRGFLNSAGAPIKNAHIISDLLQVLQLPTLLLVRKCKAHQADDSMETGGNNLADFHAQQAALTGNPSVGQTSLLILTMPDTHTAQSVQQLIGM